MRSTSSRKGSLRDKKRKAEQHAISVENMRIVANLVNVKPSVPHGLDLLKHDKQQRQLKKNLAKNFDQLSSTSSSPSHGRKRSNRKRANPAERFDVRSSRARGLSNLYEIRGSSDLRAAGGGSGTPDYLRPRKRDFSHIARIFERED